MSRDSSDDVGFRNNLALSKLARTIEGPRHCDVDLYQVCPQCLHPEVFIESTSAKRKSTQYTRIIGTYCGVPTILLRHSFDDHRHLNNIDIYLWLPGRVERDDPPDQGLFGVPWSKLRDVLLWLHKQHRCPGADGGTRVI